MSSSSSPGQALNDVEAGHFKRKPSTYREFIVDAKKNSSSSSGVGKEIKYPAERNRYVLYVSLACPWASAVNTMRAVKGIDRYIEVFVVHPVFQRTKPESADDLHEGWCFTNKKERFDEMQFDGDVEPILGAKNVREVYEKSCPSDREIPGRFTVPLLFDKVTKTVVNNESTDIIQMFNSEFNSILQEDLDALKEKLSSSSSAETTANIETEIRKLQHQKDLDFFPPDLQEAILLEYAKWYETIQNGVYKCGFATTQDAYIESLETLFAALDQLEAQLSKKRYLVSNTQITLADLRLVQTLVRFDAVYYVHFKTCKKHIKEYQNIQNFVLDVVQTLGMNEKHNRTLLLNMNHIVTHYFASHYSINPKRFVPPVPREDTFDARHDRATKFSSQFSSF